MKERILVALSGGVDSAVAAAILKTGGYDCVGVTMMLTDGTESSVKDAETVADNLGIEFHAVDLRNDFKRIIIDSFVSDYENGLTPNPCVLCNRKIKFGSLFDIAKEYGCDKIATGHYARIVFENGEHHLYKAADRKKDQSYFLYGLGTEKLSKVLFPLGELTKEDIRLKAETMGLHNAHKKDSQDICFVPDGNYAEVICSVTGRDYPAGNFVDLSGNVIGKHGGMINYTVGQRKGLGAAFGKPMYVYGKNALKNEVTLCDDSELFTKSLNVRDIVFFGSDVARDKTNLLVRIRYRHEESPAEVTFSGDTASVMFLEPQRAVTPGQSAVFYLGDRVVGGGIIV